MIHIYTAVKTQANGHTAWACVLYSTEHKSAKVWSGSHPNPDQALLNVGRAAFNKLTRPCQVLVGQGLLELLPFIPQAKAHQVSLNYQADPHLVTLAQQLVGDGVQHEGCGPFVAQTGWCDCWQPALRPAYVLAEVKAAGEHTYVPGQHFEDISPYVPDPTYYGYYAHV